MTKAMDVPREEAVKILDRLEYQCRHEDVGFKFIERIGEVRLRLVHEDPYWCGLLYWEPEEGLKTINNTYYQTLHSIREELKNGG